MKKFDLHCGDSLEIMSKMPDRTIDAIITDPPYGIGVFGNAWDKGLPSIEYWQQCFRLLKPGGFLLAFSSAKTYHRLAVAIEDSGFEIRDQLMWVYSSGSLKSLNVSKLLDKNAGRVGTSIIKLKEELIIRFKNSGKTKKQIDKECGFRASNYLTLPAEGKRPDPWVHILPSQEKWVIMKKVLGCDRENQLDKSLDDFFKEAEREVIGQQTKARSKASKFALPTQGSETEYQTWDITAPATELAKQYDGYGSNLKPAHEPIVLARKPIEATMIENITKYGTGTLNVKGCSFVGTDGQERLPSNFMHDDSVEIHEILGSATKFFYCAKPSKNERNAGLDKSYNSHPTLKPIKLMENLCKLVRLPEGSTILDPFMGSGTTGIAAINTSNRFIGIEKEQEYFEIATERITFYAKE